MTQPSPISKPAPAAAPRANGAAPAPAAAAAAAATTAPSVASSAVAPPTPGQDATAAAEPPAATHIDPREAQIRAQERAWQRRKLHEQQELARNREALARQQKEWEAAVAQSLAPAQVAQTEPLPAWAEKLQQENDSLRKRLETWEQQAQKEARATRFERALDEFHRAAQGDKDHPLASAMAQKDARRFRAAAERIVRNDPSLHDEEILGMIEDEIGFYAGLSTSRGASQALAAPAAPLAPAKPVPPATESGSAPASALPPKVDFRLAEQARAKAAIEAVRKVRAERAKTKIQPKT